MKVKMLQSARGPGVRLNPGDIVELDKGEAARFIAKRIAEPVKRGRRKAVTDTATEKAVIE